MWWDNFKGFYSIQFALINIWKALQSGKCQLQLIQAMNLLNWSGLFTGTWKFILRWRCQESILGMTTFSSIWEPPDQFNRFRPLWGRLYHKNLPPLLRSKTWHTQSSGTDNFGDFQGSNPIYFIWNDVSY